MLGSLCLACNALTTLLCLPALGYLCIIPMHNCFPCSRDLFLQSKPCCTAALSFHAQSVCVATLNLIQLNLIQLPPCRLSAIKVICLWHICEYLFVVSARLANHCPFMPSPKTCSKDGVDKP